jgi:hypothetical protein
MQNAMHVWDEFDVKCNACCGLFIVVDAGLVFLGTQFPTASSDGNNKPVGEMAIEGGGPRTLMEKNEHENNPSTHERVEHSGTSAIAVAIKNTASQMFDLNFCPHHDTTANTTSVSMMRFSS